MACTSSTAPINISKNEYTDDCSLKCLFKYNYPRVPATTLNNQGNYLEVSYDKVKINYNDNDLRVEGIRIYSPSLHTFNGVHADAEMVISHMDMGVSLLVCIPIVISSAKTDASTVLEQIIAQAVSRTPNVGEKAVVSIKNFSLNSFIPKKSPLYSYQATLPYSPCNGLHQYIVFMPDTSPAHMTSNTMGLLKKIVSPHDSKIKNNVEYFYNQRGAIFNTSESDDGDDDIYIDCHPTGADGTLLGVPINSKTPDNPSFDYTNKVMVIILGVLGGLLLIYLISILIKFWYNRRSSNTTVPASTDN